MKNCVKCHKPCGSLLILAREGGLDREGKFVPKMHTFYDFICDTCYKEFLSATPTH